MTAEIQRLQRVGRLSTIYVRSPVYFLTACTRDRQEIVAAEPVHRTFVEYGENGAARGAWIGAYVLMPDHLHLLVSLDDRDVTLSVFMKSLKNALSQTIRAAGTPSPHWQKGFFDHVLRSGESYAQKWNYVRNNPVRAKLVSHPEDWPYLGEIFPLEYLSDR